MNLPSLPERNPRAHKGTCGRALVIASSLGMTGAGALACESAYRAGAGLVTWAIPKCLAHIGEIKCTETVILPVPANDETGQISLAAREYLAEASHEADAAVLGPGMAVAGETGELLRLLIPEIHAPLVLDAGALTAIGTSTKQLEKRTSAPTILTPHPGEMSRLTGLKTEEILADRERVTVELAQKTGAIVILKGHETLITNGTDTVTNTTGNPGMATAGSGDVLAGLIVGLIAQGMEAFAASQLGVYLHGLAGDIAAELLGQHSLMAGDIMRALPRAFLKHAKSN
ncbi:MAG: NAD(P)H-hydrate dehydratase [Planctomycetota bacterium]|jgi:NAD(P)H-hydrate epimerase